MQKRVALYLRVSTAEQTVENQQRELEAVAERHGWNVVAVFADAGVSGTKGRDQRPGYDRLCRGIARREFDQVAAWSVDRLGRSLQNLVGFLGELHAKGVDLYLHQQGLDTATPAGKAMFQMLGVFSEFERAMIVERVKAGLSRARSRVSSKRRRPSVSAPEPCIGSNGKWKLWLPDRRKHPPPIAANDLTHRCIARIAVRLDRGRALAPAPTFAIGTPGRGLIDEIRPECGSSCRHRLILSTTSGGCTHSDQL